MIIGWLIERGLSPLISWLIVGGVAIAAFAGVSLYAHHEWDQHVAEPYRVEGDARTEKKLKPEIEAQTKRADLAERRLKIATEANVQLTEDIEGPQGLRAQANNSALTIERWRKLAEAARDTAKRLLAQLAEQSRKDAAEIERLRQTAAGPPLAEACQAADQILTELAVWVRQ